MGAGDVFGCGEPMSGKTPEEFWKDANKHRKELRQTLIQNIAVNKARNQLYEYQLECGFPVVRIPPHASIFHGREYDIIEAYQCKTPALIDGLEGLVVEFFITRQGELVPVYLGRTKTERITILNQWKGYSD